MQDRSDPLQNANARNCENDMFGRSKLTVIPSLNQLTLRRDHVGAGAEGPTPAKSKSFGAPVRSCSASSLLFAIFLYLRGSNADSQKQDKCSDSTKEFISTKPLAVTNTEQLQSREHK